MSQAHRAIFESYLNFQLSAAELRRQLGRGWTFERDDSGFSLQSDVDVSEPLQVGIEDVSRALDVVLEGRVPPGAVQEWANLIIMSDVFELAGYLSEEESDIVRRCLHELASPEIFGELTTDRLVSMKKLLSLTGG